MKNRRDRANQPLLRSWRTAWKIPAGILLGAAITCVMEHSPVSPPDHNLVKSQSALVQELGNLTTLAKANSDLVQRLQHYTADHRAEVCPECADIRLPGFRMRSIAPDPSGLPWNADRLDEIRDTVDALHTRADLQYVALRDHLLRLRQLAE